MRALNSAEIEDIVDRYENVFKSNPIKRFAPLIGLGVLVLYGIYAWSFFGVNNVLARANWDIAGNYLADWIAYEVRPDIEMYDNHLEVKFPKFSPLGSDPQVSWITSEIDQITRTIGGSAQESSSAAEKTSSSGFMSQSAPVVTAPSFMAPGAPIGGAEQGADDQVAQTVTEDAIVHSIVEIGDAIVDIIPGLVTINRGDEILRLSIRLNEAVTPRDPLPEWAIQKAVGGKVILGLGFAGRVEVEDDEVKVRHRFLGWENFLFDTRSPFWGLPLSEVAAMIFSGPQIEPGVSNLSLAWDDILNNAEWQHGDVWIKLLQTIVMAFVGTLFASLLAFPLAFAAARNITRNKVVNQVLKRLFDFLRSVDMLLWALVFTRTFGPGPLAGISAIFFTDTGTFGKLYSEALENIDDKQREGISSVGANPVLVQRYGVVPQVLPVFLSQSLYFWESNTRSATIIGAVGAGGIGLKLWEAMRTNSDWENVAYMVVLILIVVFIFDNISGFLRARLTGTN
jgi:phosphonate transport system permease protein